MDRHPANEEHAIDRAGTDAAITDAAVIVIAHGSRMETANVAHHSLCARLGDQLGRTVIAAFLELATPDLPAAVRAAVGAGADRIVVVPYFVHPGNHTSRDIPALVDDARDLHRGVDITIAPLFGADPALLDVLADQIRQATDDPHVG